MLFFPLVAVWWKYEITALVLRLNTYWIVVMDQVQKHAANQKSTEVQTYIYIYCIDLDRQIDRYLFISTKIKCC